MQANTKITIANHPDDTLNGKTGIAKHGFKMSDNYLINFDDPTLSSQQIDVGNLIATPHKEERELNPYTKLAQLEVNGYLYCACRQEFCHKCTCDHRMGNRMVSLGCEYEEAEKLVDQEIRDKWAPFVAPNRGQPYTSRDPQADKKKISKKALTSAGKDPSRLRLWDFEIDGKLKKKFIKHFSMKEGSGFHDKNDPGYQVRI